MSIENFDDVFGPAPDTTYDEDLVGRIKHNRKVLEGELFVDRSLKALGIRRPSKLFPPRSPEDLEQLHQFIIESERPEHQKQSVLYYILKGLPENADIPTAESFATQYYLPGKYRTFIDGIWHLDTLDLEQALIYLTNPSLTPIFAEEILYTLCRLSKPQDDSLPLAYYNMGLVSFESSKALEAFFTVLCRANVTEAFFFARARDGIAHRNLFERLIEFALSSPQGATRTSRSTELISLPLSDTEESWFEEYLKEGQGRRLSGANDTLIMRGLAIGRADALSDQDRNRHHRKIHGVDWATLGNTTKRISQKSLSTV